MADIRMPEPVADWYRIEAKGAGKARASLHIYDAIGGWFGVNVSELVAELADVDADDIDVYINSPGGDAFGGLAIANALRRHEAKVTVHVDGLAASAASLVAMGGDVVEMGRGSQLMIHEASGLAWGPAAVMSKQAAVLDKVSDSYAAVYAARAGGTAADWREAMREESWYTAEEAVNAGLADRTVDTEDEPEDVEAAWDLSIYAHAGRSKAPDPVMPTCGRSKAPDPTGHAGAFRWAQEQAEALLVGYATNSSGPHLHFQTSTTPVVAASPAPGDENQQEECSMAFMDDVRQRLGADADADEAAVLAALDARLARPNVPEGTSLIESAQLDQLQADAAAGRAARDAQLQAERDALIEAAVRDGRIAPARREHWAAQLEHDPGLAEVIASLPQIVNTAEKGYTGGAAESAEDALFARIFTKEASHG